MRSHRVTTLVLVMALAGLTWAAVWTAPAVRSSPGGSADAWTAGAARATRATHGVSTAALNARATVLERAFRGLERRARRSPCSSLLRDVRRAQFLLLPLGERVAVAGRLARRAAAGPGPARGLLRLAERMLCLQGRAIRLERRAGLPGRAARQARLDRARVAMSALRMRLLRKARAKPAPALDPQPAPQPTAPAPAPGPTPAPPAPSPTPSSPSPIPPGSSPTVITDLSLGAGQHDLVYENCVFTSTRAFQRATVTLTSAHHITFRNSVIEGSAWNAVSINSRGSIHDITFENVVIESTQRMGFECTERGSPGFFNITLDNVTVRPSGSEAISFDGAGHHITVTDTVIEGAGTRPDLFPWGQGFEINGNSDVTVDGLTVYRTRGDSLNLNGPAGASGWSFRDLLIDASVDNLGGIARGAVANLLYARNMTGAVLQGRLNNVGPSPMGYLDACSANDFSGLLRSGSPAGISQVNGCAGNGF